MTNPTLAQATASSWTLPTTVQVVIALLLAGVLLMLSIMVFRKPKSEGAATDAAPATPSEGTIRNTLARNVMVFSICAVSLLSIAVLFSSGKQANLVFGAVLPLLGTWVGTVLAYYFSRENLEAATRSVSSLADRIAPADGLDNAPVQTRMRRLADIKYKTSERGKEKELLLTELNVAGMPRVVVLDAKKCMRYLIYRESVLACRDAFAQRPANAGGGDVDALTLADLLLDESQRKLFEECWAHVGPNATMAEARRQMKARGEKCNDVFVTADGERTSPIIGWITDNRLDERRT